MCNTRNNWTEDRFLKLKTKVNPPFAEDALLEKNREQ